VNGNPLALSWYISLLSAAVLAPLFILAGEVPDVLKLLFGVNKVLVDPGAITPLQTLVCGSLITVSLKGV
jgi:solute carrier family 35 (GDP-fucose transporter), member C1